MPTFKSVAVRVLGGDGQPLAEWGQQHYRDMSSCYIQSQNDMQFSISLALTDAFARESRSFQLLATLRIDGREKPEKCAILYLDKTHKYYKSSTNGEVVMDGRKMLDDNGKMRWFRWVFKEVGIESMLDELDLNIDSDNSDTSDPSPDDDPLVAAFQGFSSNLAEKVETSKAGLIEIELRRVRVASSARTRDPTPEEYTDDTGRAVKAGKDISHSTSRYASEHISQDTSYISYWPVVEGEGPYARFKFFYRSEDVLRKYGFDGFIPKEHTLTDRVNQSLGRSQTISALTKRSLDESVKQMQKKPRKVKASSALSSDSDSDSDDNDDEEARFTFPISNRKPGELPRSESMTTHAGGCSESVEKAALKHREKPSLAWNPQEGTGNAMQLAEQQAGGSVNDKENDMRKE